MGHSNVWNSHPKNYGPGSRVCTAETWGAPKHGNNGSMDGDLKDSLYSYSYDKTM
uniref:Uncharacterized protein n=1 Tax=Zea mays TaxID=4577 RepID=A0A804M4S8_MAIZE